MNVRSDKKSNFIFFTIICLAGCLPLVASDIYAPSLSDIAVKLHTHVNTVQLTMAIYMFGNGLAQLIYGPISEGIGRRTPLLVGMAIMLVGTSICLFANTIQIILAGRFVQGIGAGAASSLWRSMFRDRYQGDELAKYSSYLVVVITFIIPPAPGLGSYLQHYFGWRASFLFVGVYLGVTLLITFRYLVETNQKKAKEKLKLSFILPTIMELLKNRVFVFTSLYIFLCYGALFSWFVAGPVLLIDTLKLSPLVFGWISFLGFGSAFALSGYLNGKFVTRYGIKTMLRLGWSIMLSAGLLMLLGKLIIGVNLWAITIPAILFKFGITFIWPNAFANAFNGCGHMAGYAGALYGFMQLNGASAIGAMVSHLHELNQIPFAMIILITGGLSWLIFETLVRPALPIEAIT